MTTEELLLQLRDIQPPPEPAWWLPAPAHLAAFAILSLALVSAWALLRRRRANRLALLAQRELRRIELDYRQNRDERLLAIRLSAWLKRVALLAFPGQRLQSSSGGAWLEFLDHSLGDDRFSQGCGRLFAAAVYQPTPDFDADAVIELCAHWLGSIRPRLQRRSRAQ